MEPNILLIARHAGGFDGVSVETEKWRKYLSAAGFEIKVCAAYGTPDVAVDVLADQPTVIGQRRWLELLEWSDLDGVRKV